MPPEQPQSPTATTSFGSGVDVMYPPEHASLAKEIDARGKLVLPGSADLHAERPGPDADQVVGQDRGQAAMRGGQDGHEAPLGHGS